MVPVSGAVALLPLVQSSFFWRSDAEEGQWKMIEGAFFSSGTIDVQTVFPLIFFLWIEGQSPPNKDQEGNYKFGQALFKLGEINEDEDSADAHNSFRARNRF